MNSNTVSILDLFLKDYGPEDGPTKYVEWLYALHNNLHEVDAESRAVDQKEGQAA